MAKYKVIFKNTDEIEVDNVDEIIVDNETYFLTSYENLGKTVEFTVPLQHVWCIQKQ